MAKVAPGLVIINTALQYNSEAAAATGIVITSDGLVLTNNHVIEDSTSITATTANGKQYQAKVLGYDVTGDIALIQLQGASGLRIAPLGTSSAVRTGDSGRRHGQRRGAERHRARRGPGHRAEPDHHRRRRRPARSPRRPCTG